MAIELNILINLNLTYFFIRRKFQCQGNKNQFVKTKHKYHFYNVFMYINHGSNIIPYPLLFINS